MSDTKSLVTVNIDAENEDVVFSCSTDGLATEQRCRILYGWLLLYLLAPEPFDEIGSQFCESMLAKDPPVGMEETDEYVVLVLPDGFLKIPADRQKELKDALAAKLLKFAESTPDLF